MILWKEIYLSGWLVLSLFRMDMIMKEVIKVIGQKVVTDDDLSDEDESDEEEEIAHAVPVKCTRCC
jgi:hypothetical protein